MPLASTQPSPEPANHAVPRHIAIIMDGNGRWAEAHGRPRKLGHQKGSEALKNLVTNCKGMGIDYITVYAFSSENWNRSDGEVTDLMDLLRYYLRREVKTLHKNNVRIQFIGDRSALADDIQEELIATEELTKQNTALHLTIALSYGARQEMMRTIKTIAQEIAKDQLRVEDIDEYTVLAHLDTANLPDPDLLIRTGGEQRLSNFLLWQSAYTELYFTDTLWPDFTIEHLKDAMDDYAQRERRFGGRDEA